MFVNLTPASRAQLLGLVQTMHLSEADVVAFALQQLFDQKHPNYTSGEGEEPAKRSASRRRLVRGL